MALLVQKAAASGKVVSFANPTVPGNLIILVMTWDQDPPAGNALENFAAGGTGNFPSNIADDGGNKYPVVDYNHNNCGIWASPFWDGTFDGGNRHVAPTNSAKTI